MPIHTRLKRKAGHNKREETHDLLDKISTKLDKLYKKAKLNKPAKSDQPNVNKKTKLKATHSGRSIRIEPVPEGTGLDSPGEYGETCEGLTHATVAICEPDISIDAIILRDDPHNKEFVSRAKNYYFLIAIASAKQTPSSPR